jgi:hypothetical protein
MSLNLPAVHATQVAEPASPWKRPALQLTQALASTLAENWPAAHSAHPPVLDLYFPAVHDAISPAPPSIFGAGAGAPVFEASVSDASIHLQPLVASHGT